jgi:hypothetical protein
MRWNDDKKHDHERWEKPNSVARIKSTVRSVMASVHNKFSRGAEYIAKMMPYPRKENWRKNHGHNSEKKKD